MPLHLACNVPDELIYSNVRVNSRRPGKWLQQEPAHDRVAVLCGSGPSLADHIDEVVRMRWPKGRSLSDPPAATLFAMNGAASYLFGHDIVCDYQVLIDARPQTAELVGPAMNHPFRS